MSDRVDLTRGDPAPHFIQRSLGNPRYAFDTAAGRWIALAFFGSAADPAMRAMLDAVAERRDLFDDRFASFFGVSVDPADEREARIAERIPGLRHFLDHDLAVSRLYGALPRAQGQGTETYRRFWLILDPTLRVARAGLLGPEGAAPLLAAMAELPPPGRYAGVELQAPVLLLPDVFEPELCDRLVGLYEAEGGRESGFMRDVGGKTVGVTDRWFKSRRDCEIEDEALLAAIRERFVRRVVPEIQKAHQFAVTRMERYIVSCYDAAEEGHFRPHRDNTTKGTAHRRFAASVNLNDEFEGGELSFPEYGRRSFKPPKGAAVVFSCSLLHAVSRVTEGRRFAFLPFLYDDAAAALRERNRKFLAEKA